MMSTEVMSRSLPVTASSHQQVHLQKINYSQTESSAQLSQSKIPLVSLWLLLDLCSFSIWLFLAKIRAEKDVRLEPVKFENTGTADSDFSIFFSIVPSQVKGIALMSRKVYVNSRSK